MARRDSFTDKVNKAVGGRVGELRITMGLSRQQLGEKIDVTHQQLQKYEKGTNRISVGRLAVIAKALNKPIDCFFEGIDKGEELPTQHQRMCIEVSRNFLKINNREYQDAVNILVRILSKGDK